MWILAFAVSSISLAGLQAEAPAAQPQAREIGWPAFCARAFDPQWALPLPTEAEADGQPRDLVAHFLAWSERDLRLAPAASAPATEAPYCLGDLVDDLAPFRRNHQDLSQRLELAARQLPGLSTQERAWLLELLSDGGLHNKKWKPDDDRKDDGILHLGKWELDAKTKRAANWRTRKGDDSVQRSATLVFADLDTWFAVESDADAYLEHAGNSYESVAIPAERQFVSQSPEFGPVLGQAIEVRADLPFPFGGYTSDNRVRRWLRPDGLVVNEVYNPPSSDFHWLAGRDVFLPLTTQEGKFVGVLVVQEFGFDLNGVPEGDGARKTGVRSALGNKKREAERRFQPDQEIPAQRGRLPGLPQVSSSPK